jgi:Peptidase A4 family
VSHLRPARQSSNGAFTLALTDGTTFSVTATNRSAARSSAEVIVESPSSNHGPFGALPLTDFGTVAFTSTTVNGGTLASASPDELVMKKSSTVEATPNSLSGGVFSVQWEHS